MDTPVRIISSAASTLPPFAPPPQMPVDRELASLTAGQVPGEVFSARTKAFYTWVETNMPKFTRKE